MKLSWHAPRTLGAPSWSYRPSHPSLSQWYLITKLLWRSRYTFMMRQLKQQILNDKCTLISLQDTVGKRNSALWRGKQGQRRRVPAGLLWGEQFLRPSLERKRAQWRSWEREADIGLHRHDFFWKSEGIRKDIRVHWRRRPVSGKSFLSHWHDALRTLTQMFFIYFFSNAFFFICDLYSFDDNSRWRDVTLTALDM